MFHKRIPIYVLNLAKRGSEPSKPITMPGKNTADRKEAALRLIQKQSERRQTLELIDQMGGKLNHTKYTGVGQVDSDRKKSGISGFFGFAIIAILAITMIASQHNSINAEPVPQLASGVSERIN